MQANDGNRFRDLLRGMGRMYSQDVDALTLDAYWLALGDWSLEDFEGACRQLMKTAKFMPRPADFTELRKAARPTAGEAWTEVLAYVRGGGIGTGLPDHDFDGRAITDPLVIAAVRAIGGFEAIGRSTTDQTPFLERRFAEHYEAIGDREGIRQALPQIAGEPRARVSGPRSLLAISDSLYNRPGDDA